MAVWGAIGALAVLALSGIVVSQVTAALAAQTPSPSPTPKLEAPDRPGHMGKGFPGLLRPGGYLHGEFTVEKSGGGYEVVVVQKGTVTGKSADTLTVRSEDGYSATYTVNSDTRIVREGDQAKLADLANDDTVYVAGVKSGSTVTARFVHEGRLLAKGFRHGDGPGPWRHGPSDAPSPSPTST